MLKSNLTYIFDPYENQFIGKLIKRHTHVCSLEKNNIIGFFYNLDDNDYPSYYVLNIYSGQIEHKIKFYKDNGFLCSIKSSEENIYLSFVNNGIFSYNKFNKSVNQIISCNSRVEIILIQEPYIILYDDIKLFKLNINTNEMIVLFILEQKHLFIFSDVSPDNSTIAITAQLNLKYKVFCYNINESKMSIIGISNELKYIYSVYIHGILTANNYLIILIYSTYSLEIYNPEYEKICTITDFNGERIYNILINSNHHLIILTDQHIYTVDFDSSNSICVDNILNIYQINIDNEFTIFK
jgi:hypothetical protein